MVNQEMLLRVKLKENKKPLNQKLSKDNVESNGTEQSLRKSV